MSVAPGLWINKGIIVQSKSYLEGLWQACKNQGAIFKKCSIHSLDEVKDYDVVILTLGAHSLHFPELKRFPLTTVKGQILRLQWPNELPPLPFVLNTQALLWMKIKKAV